MPSYEWWEIVEGSELQQGDILENVDIYLALPAEQKNQTLVQSVVETHDVIILTQSCDINKESCRYILLCPVWTLEDAKKEIPHFQNKKGLEDLRTGRVVGYHLINKCEKSGFKRDFRIINFSRVFEISKSRAVAIADSNTKRLRLLPPYREHFSQAFARFFMRVGLPTDIDKFA